MKLSEIKNILPKLENVEFQLENGTFVPEHFHVTEVGQIDKKFIDCGGTLRNESVISLQLWSANDYNHRLHPEKLIHIIELSEAKLGLENLDIEVEYQGESIQKYGLQFDGTHFLLTTKQTDCLAKDNCGIPVKKPKLKLADLSNEPCCSPDGNCC